jgi:hypothetical protein
MAASSSACHWAAHFPFHFRFASKNMHCLLPPCAACSKSKISVAEASRIAAEIERGDHSALANSHMLEERGVAIDDSQMDEEDRYGAVVRDAPPPPPSSARGVANGAGGHAAQPRPNAWAQGRPVLPGAAPSQPISIDSRREANKLRMQVCFVLRNARWLPGWLGVV